MLTAKEIKYVLSMLAKRVVVEPTKDFPYTISCQESGYSSDIEVGKLQVKLSIMLEMLEAARRIPEDT